ncbi:MAG: hypothetical protein ACKVPX_12950 [Myxococcaceae bacterium]
MTAAALAKLVLAALALLAAVLWKRRRTPVAGRAVQTLHVEAGLAIGPRSRLAVVAWEGRRFLIVHGEGFAQRIAADDAGLAHGDTAQVGVGGALSPQAEVSASLQ